MTTLYNKGLIEDFVYDSQQWVKLKSQWVPLVTAMKELCLDDPKVAEMCKEYLDEY